MVRRLLKGCLVTVLLLAALVAVVAGYLLFDARRAPAGQPEYVAMGSSFAAGADLGPLTDDSPWLCARSISGYPHLLASRLRLSLVDMSCGGAKAGHLLNGGQFFQRPQIWPIGAETRLVTITVGGNDSLYIGDLSQLAARNTNSLWGRLVRQFWSGPRTMQQRDFPKLQAELVALLRGIRSRAPAATIVIATYPAILPQAGSCDRLALTGPEAEMMRQVGDRLAATTRAAAREGGALLVDMHAIGASHHACSADPWTRGWTNGGIAPFHPTTRGAQATAAAIALALGRHQQL